MRFAHVVIRADNATLEDGEEVFGSVAVREASLGNLFIPLSVLSSCAIGFVLPAGLGHPIGASRSQRSGGGTVRWGSWIPCSTTRCECGWRFVASLTDATLRLAIVRTRPGRAELPPSSSCRGFGAFLLQDGAGQQGGAGDGGAGYALLHL